MARKTLSVLFAFAVSVSVSPADAASKRHKRGATQAPVVGTRPTIHQEPARMYEVRPGHWISTWGCFTDEGYGRIGSCDRREGQ